MATQYVCFHNKYGYCKFGEECQKRHVNTICEDRSCEIRKCLSRHPKVCKFYNYYRRCKFNPCAFLHVDKDASIEEMKRENVLISEKIRKTEEAIQELDDQLAFFKNLDEKSLIVENKLDKFETFP